MVRWCWCLTAGTAAVISGCEEYRVTEVAQAVVDRAGRLHHFVRRRLFFRVVPPFLETGRRIAAGEIDDMNLSERLRYCALLVRCEHVDADGKDGVRERRRATAQTPATVFTHLIAMLLVHAHVLGRFYPECPGAIGLQPGILIVECGLPAAAPVGAPVCCQQIQNFIPVYFLV